MAKLTQGINPSKLDQEIKDLGIRARVYHSTICPNMKSLESLDHDINCSVCNNNMIDFCPKETIILIQQQNLNQQFNAQGTFSIDEVMVSFLSDVTLQHYARVDILDFCEDFMELVERQVGGTVDRLKYSATDVLGLFTVVNNARVTYRIGSDFELDVNGDIKWTGSRKPSDKQIYTIYYKYRPVFRAIKAVHRTRYSQYNLRPQELTSPNVTVNGATFVKLPEQWILVRDNLVERRDMLNALLPVNQLHNPNE